MNSSNHFWDTLVSLHGHKLGLFLYGSCGALLTLTATLFGLYPSRKRQIRNLSKALRILAIFLFLVCGGILGMQVALALGGNEGIAATGVGAAWPIILQKVVRKWESESPDDSSK